MQRIVGNVRVNINKSKHASAAVSKMADTKGDMAKTVVVLILFVFRKRTLDKDDLFYELLFILISTIHMMFHYTRQDCDARVRNKCVLFGFGITESLRQG